MRKRIPRKLTHVYDIAKSHKTVWHYHLNEGQCKPILLTESIKLMEDKSYFQLTGKPYTFHLRGEKKWCRASTYLTPIFQRREVFFYGGIEIKNKKSLLVFQLRPDKGQLVIDVFQGFYPSDVTELEKALEDITCYWE